ncbi:MAG: hypothetical protein SZ59_C0002G0113 [candidate division TM6 bacterium GW2011_GWF2_28_16]|nr:MAG: hypothetical protein SZ59_C0002G0113 [candidate division TM6 bacterium GW2011_GWF2_28_16]
MKIIYYFLKKIENLSKKEFEKYLKIIIASIFCFSMFLTFLFHSKNNDLITEIRNSKNLASKTSDIVRLNKKMQQEEDKLQILLEQEKDFDLNVYFEQLCKEQNITPEPNWEPITQEFIGSDKFDEVSLQATFKDQTTQKLVFTLQELNKKEIVYIKELIIRQQGNNKIEFDITLATKKFKRNI